MKKKKKKKKGKKGKKGIKKGKPLLFSFGTFVPIFW
jgi:hypothetical protein